MTHTEPQTSSGPGFLAGVVAGGILGTAVTFYLAPRLTAELRLQISDAARRLRRDAAEHLEHITTRVGEALDPVANNPAAEAVRDSVPKV
jgi:gas vesicle protein